MDTDIEAYVKACARCAQNKASYRKSETFLQPLTMPESPREEISIDLPAELPRTPAPEDAIVTIVCRLTKMVHFVPSTSGVTPKGLAQLLIREAVRLHGVPKAIVRDRHPRSPAKRGKRSVKSSIVSKRCPQHTDREQRDRRRGRTKR